MGSGRPTVEQLLDGLRADALLDDAGRARAIEHLQRSAEKPSLPWFIRGLIGAGAWFAAGFFIAFMGIADLIDSETGLLAWGLVWIAAAATLRWFTRSVFPGQLALAMSVAGHGMTLFGVGETFEYGHNWLPGHVVLAGLVLCAALYPLYRDRTHRFLSCCMVLTLLIFWICDLDGGRSLLHGVAVAAAASAAWLLVCRPRPALRPIAHASVLCVPVVLLVMTVGDDLEIPLWPANLSMGVGAILACIWAAGGFSRLRSEAVVVAVAVTVLLAPFTNPGILAALGLLVLGYALYDWFVMAVAVASLPTFIVFYYYDLEMNLAHKSVVLGGSGLVLLAARWVLSTRPWAREARS